jgi:diguanylate cyclase (GGDEF)-like protein
MKDIKGQNCMDQRAKIHILVVDDDDVDRERLIRCLRNFPSAVGITEAVSFTEAQHAVSHAAFDTIIVDNHLGDGQGLDILDSLQESKNAICPVILVTAFSSERDAVAAMRRGAYDYIPKHELDANRLSQVIMNGLRWASSQAQLFEAERELRRRSLYDTLTGLPNRNLFFDRLEQACTNTQRYQTPFAVMMMDLDRFKEVNDTLGHAAGDQVLQHTANRLAATCRHSDTISRLAGDEFSAICLGVESAEAALVVADKMLAGMKAPVIVEGKALSVGISIGIAFCPIHGHEPGQLMSLADKAMYQAKTGLRKAICAPIGPDLKAPPLPAQAMLSEIEQAIDAREFTMFYQPKINLQTYQLVGVEALMRWRQPNGAIADPDKFIPVVETSNLLSKFTLMSIELVLAQMADWASRGIVLDVAMNISAKMLEDTTLAHHLARRLADYDVRAELLTLEITETAIILNPDAARKVAEQITAIGVKLSIDDFGSGFTSFTYLQEFSIPEIKIDKNFIMNLKPKSFGASLVRCVSAFCQSEGIRLVAEGVEHRESWQLLCDLGCDIGQGYSIARPAAAREFETWMTDSGPSRRNRSYQYDA